MDMKTAISLPDPIFRSAERLAEKLGVSRSELYCRALRELLDRNDDDTVRKRLDEVYGPGREDPGLEPEIAAMQARSVRGRKAW
jgi:Arc/MetJ-type ribon-helix-helix transcriptional regulator